ncbi:MAG: hypothetical protein E7774_04390 [Bradyrhizobium sp.]|nr:MAG: hypothetical protein E7774_04390 [Bradyrhizobium sp.]
MALNVFDQPQIDAMHAAIDAVAIEIFVSEAARRQVAEVVYSLASDDGLLDGDALAAAAKRQLTRDSVTTDEPSAARLPDAPDEFELIAPVGAPPIGDPLSRVVAVTAFLHGACEEFSLHHWPGDVSEIAPGATHAILPPARSFVL